MSHVYLKKCICGQGVCSIQSYEYLLEPKDSKNQIHITAVWNKNENIDLKKWLPFVEFKGQDLRSESVPYRGNMLII